MFHLQCKDRVALPVGLPPGPKIPALLQALLIGFWPRRFQDYCARHYGDCFTTWIPRLPPFVRCSNPEDIRTVFEADGEKVHAANRPLNLVLGENSLLILHGDRHARDRRLLGALLHGEPMRQYCEMMIAETDRAIDRWPLGRQFQIHPKMQHIALNVIMRAVFGDDAGPEMGELRERLRELLGVAAGTLWMVPWLRTIGGRFSLLARIRQARCRVDELLTEVLVRRRQNDTRGRDDIFSLLIEGAHDNGCDLSDQEIRDETITLLVVGHETTATALAWTITRVHEHADVVTAAKKELDEVLAGGKPTPSKLESLRYLDAIIRETLRLNPVVPDVGRLVSRPIRIGGYELPAGVIVVPSIDLTHRNPEVWPEPEKFRPERFLERRPGPYEFFPFGGGIRRCIGMSFALFETKVVLARVLSRCDLRLAPGYRPRMKRRAITMAPSRGAPAVMDRCRAVYNRPQH